MEWKTLEKNYLSWLEEEKKQVEKRMGQLRLQGCGDDAMMEQIRLNLYDAFYAVIRAGEKQKEGEEAAFCLKRFQDILAAWEEKLQAAQIHGDAKATAIESLKIETAQHLKTNFLRAMEGRI